MISYMMILLLRTKRRVLENNQHLSTNIITFLRPGSSVFSIKVQVLCQNILYYLHVIYMFKYSISVITIVLF